MLYPLPIRVRWDFLTATWYTTIGTTVAVDETLQQRHLLGNVDMLLPVVQAS